MSSRSARLYLADILDAIEKIGRYVSGQTREEFVRDSKTVEAVQRNLMIIGEAAARVPLEIRAANPSVPWVEIAGMRNKVVHEHFGVDEEMLWKTITEDLHSLREQICGVLEQVEVPAHSARMRSSSATAGSSRSSCRTSVPWKVKKRAIQAGVDAVKQPGFKPGSRPAALGFSACPRVFLTLSTKQF